MCTYIRFFCDMEPLKTNFSPVKTSKSFKYCCMCYGVYRGKVINNRTISLHKFPSKLRDKRLKRIWIQRCKFIKKDFKWTKNKFLCSQHFVGLCGPTEQFNVPSLFPLLDGTLKDFNTLDNELTHIEQEVPSNHNSSHSSTGNDSSVVQQKKETKAGFDLTNPTSSYWDHSYSILSGSIGPNEPSPVYMAKFDSIICDFMKEQGVPGAALCVHLNGRPIYRQGYGINYSGDKVTSSSKFRIASISKVLTAIGIMKLVEEGRLDLDVKLFQEKGPLHPLSIYISWKSQQKYYRMTVRHLLEHSAGWDREKDDDQVFWYQKREHQSCLNPMQVTGHNGLVAYVLTRPLRFTPGTRHCYSNFGYLLLGIVIERVTGMEYEDYMCGVLGQIGITDMYVGLIKTCVDYREIHYYNNKKPAVAKSILPREGKVAPQYGSFPMKTTGAYGGWVADAGTLALILDTLNACLNPPEGSDPTDRWLSAASVQQMLKCPRYGSGDAWYGLGLDICDFGQSFGHTGAMEGTTSTVHHNKKGFTWSLLLNAWSRDIDLDGVITFALSSINCLAGAMPSLKQEICLHQAVSADQEQCVQILLPRNCLYNHVTEMRAQGYFITHINALSINDDVQFNIVWTRTRKKDTGIPQQHDWCIVMDIDMDEFNSFVKKLSDGNFYVYFIELYHVRGRVFHLFVYDQEPQCKQELFSVEQSTEVSMYHRVRYKHFCCISQSVLHCNGKVYYACIFNKLNKEVTKSKTYSRWLDYSLDKFPTGLSRQIQDACTMTHMQFYPTNSEPKISALWVNKNHRKFGEIANVYQRHDITKYGMMNELRETMLENLHVLYLSAYDHDGVVYFACIWDAKKRATICHK